MKNAVFGLLVFLLTVTRTHAWNAEGHMVVAQIAYDNLTPDVKAQCDALIAVPLTYSSTQSSNFVTAACWADDFKQQLNTANWHYIDIPFSLDGTSTNSFAGDSFDVVRAIQFSELALGQPSTTTSNRAVFLRYLLHFVGDVHQPLHASTAISAAYPGGDAGGNNFTLTGTWSELHALWDAGGGYVGSTLSRPLSNSSKTTLSNKVAQVETDYPYVANAGIIANPMDWALEGWNLAQTVAYVGITQGSTPSSTYTNAAQHTSESRLALAGHRLADVLNTIFTVYPAIIQPNAPANGTVSFWWNVVPGRVYRIQSKQSLTDSWTDVTTVSTSATTYTFTDTPGATTKFYQIIE